MLDQDQFNEYKKFYDYAMEIYNTAPKIQSNASMMMFRPINKDGPAYNNYFKPDVKDKTRKLQK